MREEEFVIEKCCFYSLVIGELFCFGKMSLLRDWLLSPIGYYRTYFFKCFLSLLLVFD